MAKTKPRKTLPLLKSRLKKDPGIPKIPNIKERRWIRTKFGSPPVGQVVPNGDSDSTMASEPTLTTLVHLASLSTYTDRPSSPMLEPVEVCKEQIRKYFLKTLHRVIDQSDIVALVLDSRDPEGSRSRLVEEEVRRREAEGKKLIFVLNKIDLIPKSNAQAWLKHLRHSTPTLPFRCASQLQRFNLSSATAPALMKLLKAYKPTVGSFTIGVVGYPNVGKSSLINSLKRSKVCAVAAQPGHTKDLQTVQLERGMKIIDSPGVIFDGDNDSLGDKQSQKGSVLLRNVVRAEDVEDPIAVVEEVLYRVDRETIKDIYNLPDYNSTIQFLSMLAVTSGRLLKGGSPDLNSAARQVLTDWNHQKIPYFSIPPAVHTLHVSSTASSFSGSGPLIVPDDKLAGHARLLDSFSKPFVLEGLFSAADAGAFNGSSDVAMINGVAKDGYPMDQDVEDDTDSMRIDDVGAGFRSKSRKRKGPPTATLPTLDSDQPSEPKRQRRAKLVPDYHDLPDRHVLSAMECSNPLSRKNLKRVAKRARKERFHAKSPFGAEIIVANPVSSGNRFTFIP